MTPAQFLDLSSLTFSLGASLGHTRRERSQTTSQSKAPSLVKADYLHCGEVRLLFLEAPLLWEPDPLGRSSRWLHTIWALRAGGHPVKGSNSMNGAFRKRSKLKLLEGVEKGSRMFT